MSLKTYGNNKIMQAVTIGKGVEACWWVSDKNRTATTTQQLS
jgi:hypothetical protein